MIFRTAVWFSALERSTELRNTNRKCPENDVNEDLIFHVYIEIKNCFQKNLRTICFGFPDILEQTNLDFPEIGSDTK